MNKIMNNHEENNDYLKNYAEMTSALVKAISETQDVHADSTNPFHKNKYASLSAHLAVLKPIFAKNGLAIAQFPVTEEGCIGVRTTVIHKDGGNISGFVGVPMGTAMKGQDAGAVISYLRRYSLASIAGVATEDDDAEFDRIAKSPQQDAPKQQYASSAPRASAPASSSSSDIVVPFGKQKGVKLTDLDEYNLNYWANTWEPKPWEKTGKVGPKDLALKALAVKLWSEKSGSPVETEETSDDVPF